MSRHHQRPGMLRNVPERYWWPQLYADITGWVRMCDHWEKTALLWYEEHLKCLTVSHLWQRVGMDISYMPKMEDRYHLLIVATEYLSMCSEAGALKQVTLKKVADFFYEKVINCFRNPESGVVYRQAQNKKHTNILRKHYHIRKITVTQDHAAANADI